MSRQNYPFKPPEDLILLIDGDALAWSTAASIESSKHLAIDVINKLHMHWLDIIFRCKSSRYHLYLSGKDNFRYKRAVTIPYKGNRKDVVKPESLSEVRYLLEANYGAVVIDGYEADDALATMQRIYKDKSMIVTPDKDLRQVQGHFFNNHYSKNNYTYVTEKEAIYNLYKQVLKGDMTDNIPGIKGVGDKTVEALVNAYLEYTKNTDSLSDISLRDICCAFYGTMFPSKNPKDITGAIEAIKLFHEMFDLVYMHNVPLNEKITKLNVLNENYLYEQ